MTVFSFGMFLKRVSVWFLEEIPSPFLILHLVLNQKELYYLPLSNDLGCVWLWFYPQRLLAKGAQNFLTSFQREFQDKSPKMWATSCYSSSRETKSLPKVTWLLRDRGWGCRAFWCQSCFLLNCTTTRGRSEGLMGWPWRWWWERREWSILRSGDEGEALTWSNTLGAGDRG